MLYRFQNIQTLTWDSVNAHYSKKYPSILALVDLILTLPASSAEIDQGSGKESHHDASAL